MAKILGREREDIVAMWNELGVAPHTQQDEFPLFFADLSSLEEDALTNFEQYADMLRGRLEVLRPLLAKVQKREMCVSDRLEYEQLIMNPERCALRFSSSCLWRTHLFSLCLLFCTLLLLTP